MPPVNESANVDGTYDYASTVSQLVAAQLLKENGISAAG